MTARPVAPVIPAASPGRRRQGGSGAGRPMPLASPPGRPTVVYGFGRIDASGRVADRVTIAALGWLDLAAQPWLTSRRTTRSESALCAEATR
jgi:hypothetical protein